MSSRLQLLTDSSQIRARRLAKLGTSSTPAPTSSPTDENKAPESNSAPPPEPTESEPSKLKAGTSPAASASQANPFAQLGGESGGVPEARTTSPGSSRTDRKRPASEIDDVRPAPQPRRPIPTAVVESDEDYANRVLTQVFRITVDPHHMTNPQGQRLVFLPGLNEELNESGEPLKLSSNNLDQAIIEAATSWPQDKPLMSYLLPCWKRAVKAASTAKVPAGPKAETHDEAKRLCMSNCLFALTMPALFGLVVHC